MTSFVDDPAASVSVPPAVVAAAAAAVALENSHHAVDDVDVDSLLMGNGESRPEDEHQAEDPNTESEADNAMAQRQLRTRNLENPLVTDAPKPRRRRKRGQPLTKEEEQELKEQKEQEGLDRLSKGELLPEEEERRLFNSKKKKRKNKENAEAAAAEAPVPTPALEPTVQIGDQPVDVTIEEHVATGTPKKEKKKRKKKNRQTLQEEESAQALLALNKGVSTGDNEHAIEDDEGVIAATPTEGTTKPVPKKKRGKSKKVLSKEVISEDEDNAGSRGDMMNIDEDVETAEAALNQVLAAESSGTIPTTEPTTRSRESTDLPESQRIISEHLAAHMSKIAPPPPPPPPQTSSQLSDEISEQRLTTLLQQNGFQVGTSDDSQGFVSINRTTETSQMPKGKRKRGADAVPVASQQGLMVDPQLMQLDQQAALALITPGEGNTGKTRKRRKAAATIIQDAAFDPALEDNAAKTPRRTEPSSKSNWGTATPNPGESVNGGTFDLAERHAIDKALADYGQAHGMSITELRDRVWGNNRKKDEFWNEICRAVPNRSRASVYKHVRRSCHIFEQRAKWTEPEDNQLAALVAEKGNKWKEIGLAMDRMGEDCRDRYRNYVKCGKDRGTDRWSAEEEELLKQTVANQMEQSRELLRKEGKPIPQDREGELTLINWTIISDLMDNRRSRIQCRYKWKKMIAQKERVQRAPIGVTYEGGKRKRIAFDTQQMLAGDKLWLVLQVRDSGAATESEIPWDAIAKNDKDIGIWTHKDLKLAFKNFRSHLPYRRRPLSEIIKELLIECDGIPHEMRQIRFVPTNAEEDGMHDHRTVSYSPSVHTHTPAQGTFDVNSVYAMAPEQAGNVAPVASMSGGVPATMAHQDPNLALDPSLAGMEDLEKTAGEAIAFSAGLEAAARVARSVVGNQEDDGEHHELRERLGSYLQATGNPAT